jgi:hypothetical protein
MSLIDVGDVMIRYKFCGRALLLAVAMALAAGASAQSAQPGPQAAKTAKSAKPAKKPKAPEYKLVAPPPPRQTDEGTGE